MSIIPRHRTALHRRQLSRPLRLIQQGGLLSCDMQIFDYGCGHGDDIANLRAAGFSAEGWDPVHQPETPLRCADVVNFGYVLNVIEAVDERAEALRRAWSLTERVLVVAARLDSEVDASADSTLLCDGFITRIGTFQKLYAQDELRAYIDQTLGADSVAAAPGVFYVFRDESVRQRFLASRYRRQVTPRLRPDQVYQTHRELLAPLLQFLCQRGRLPVDAELSGICDPAQLLAPFGTLARASQVVLSVIEQAAWAQVREQRTQDLLIYLGLSRFATRPRLGALPAELQHDIRAFFTSYHAACVLADELLAAAGNMQVVDRLCRQSPVGKTTAVALYVHVSAVSQLDPILRLYESCARHFVGDVEGANVIKLHRHKPQVSYLSYPDFDRDPHPALQASLVVQLQTFRLELRRYVAQRNPPILHRKEAFVGAEYPLYQKFQRLTEQEERMGLYAHPERIGTRDGWRAALAERKVALAGHRVVRRKAGE